MHVIAIFGAAVRADGSPSPALARRVGYALRVAAEQPDALIFCSGGTGRAGPSEASVMERILRRRGIDPRRIVLDEASRDTLESVVALARYLKAEGHAGAVACTDGYHLPRVRMMLGLLGAASQRGPVDPGAAGGLIYWTRMTLREALAIPYDCGVVLWRRRELLKVIASGQGRGDRPDAA